MKLHRDTDFEGVVPQERIAFKIAASGQLMDILSNLIYKDKVLAVIRELSCNAYDAHIAAKNPAPFLVQVPTKLDPVFAVEDFGVGLPHDKIGDIFWTYGSSTKTETNDQIGALGIGSKSPFAYTKSSFIVRSRFDGVETQYLCFINEKGTPDGSVMHSQPTTEPNGVRVELGVRAEDVQAFHNRIVSFFKYWKVKPKLHGIDLNWLKTTPMMEGNGWWLEHSASDDFVKQAKAVMGNVAYPIAYSAIGNPSAALRFIASNAFIIDVPLGELAFAASREELSYDDRTVKALEAAAARVMKDFNRVLAEKAVHVEATPIETLTRFQTYTRVMTNMFGNQAQQAGFERVELVQADGKKFSGKVLQEQSHKVSTDKQSSLMMYNLTESRSGNVRLSPAREITLTRMEDVIGADKKPKVDANGKVEQVKRTRQCQWFSPTVKPKKTIRGGQVSDFLADGWTHERTSIQLHLPTYGDLASWAKDAGQRLYFVLNDAGARGSIGARTYFAGYERERIRGRTVFVDFDQKVVPADFGEAEILELIKGTAFEGATIIKLTQLPNFVMPKAEPKVPRDKVATPPAPRGYFEVRRVYFGASGENLTIKVGGARDYIKPLAEYQGLSEYVKLDPSTLKCFYTLSAPGGMDKNLRATLMSNKVAYAFHAGLLDEHLDKPAAEGGKLSFIVRNEDDIATLRKKGAVLTNVQELIDAIDKTDTSSVTKYMDMAEAINDYGSVLYNMVNHGVLSSQARKKLEPLLTKPTMLGEAMTMLTELETFFSKDKKRIALASLSDLLPAPTSAPKKNAARMLSEQLGERYPLLSSMGVREQLSSRVAPSLAAYIMMEDDRAAQAAAAKKAAEAAAAEAAAKKAAEDQAVTTAVALAAAVTAPAVPMTV